MPENRRAEGAEAEDFAATYLTERGFTIVTRRFTVKGGELDLVALEGDELVFVEVKSRGPGQARPEETIGPKKLAALRAAARTYLNKVGTPDRLFRIDLIGIDPDGLRHYRAIGDE
jgi:putative endonuclease